MRWRLAVAAAIAAAGGYAGSESTDQETGERYTVKRYSSEKAQGEDGWRHVRISLNPTNPSYAPMLLREDDENWVVVVAEVVSVL